MKRRKAWILFSFAALVVLLFMPLPLELRVKAASRDGFAPLQNVLSLVLFRGRETLRFVSDAQTVLDEKRRMESEIADLRHEVQRLQALAQESRDLKVQLDYAQESPRRLVLCEVVARGDAVGWWQTLRINRGRIDGISEDMAVVTGDGIIGKTTEVSQRFADVLLITDPQCMVSCRVMRTGTFGIVRGTGVSTDGDRDLEMLCVPEPIQMDLMARDREVFEGDEVVTSGLGGVYPSGLRVGSVTRCYADASQLCQQADIMPVARLDRLRYVFVVLSGGGTG